MSKFAETLEEFRLYLTDSGRDPGTAELYVTHLRSADEASIDPLARLRDTSLAPFTRRSIKAAIKSWAVWQEDEALLKKLKNFKMPPPTRKHEKLPLDKDDWRQLVDLLETQEESPAILVIGLMATRGFRIGDVLRMRKPDIEKALKSKVLTFEAKGGRFLSFGVSKPVDRWLRPLVEYKGWTTVAGLLAPNSDTELKAVKAAKMQVRRLLQDLADEVGIDGVYPHRLRRTVATYFLEKVNGDIVKLKDWMQWQNINTVAGYVDHSRREELDLIGETLLDD